MKRKKHPLNALVDENIRYVEDLLLNGTIVGGKSLLSLLKEYAEKGPFNPIRNDLIKHMARCFEALANLDGCIIARARTLPHGRVDQYERRKKRFREKVHSDASTIRDLDTILNTPDSISANNQLVHFAKETVERLTLLADLFCEAADSEDGNVIHMSEEIEQAIEAHKHWKKGVPFR